MNNLLPHLSARQPSAAEYLRRILLAPVYDVAVKSDLTPMRKLSERLGCEVLLKREDQQPVHSFKIRGAYNKIAGLNADQQAKGVVAASAGNHAQGVALSGQKLGIKATIVMPNNTPDIKIDSVRRLGGNVVIHGNSFDEASAESRRLAETEGYTLAAPFDDPDVIAGQGTIGVELLQQARDMDYVFLPVGGGGLAAGVALYLKSLKPSIKVIGVEAEDSACLLAALEAGERVNLDQVGLFADGVAVKLIGEETFRVCAAFIDEVITVSTDEICAAIKDIFDDTRAVSEPAGALALAGLKKFQARYKLHGKKLTTVLSGANVNFHSLRYVSERTELGEGREGVLAVTIPEQKGSFRRFCELLGGHGITEFNYRFADPAKAHIYVGVRLAEKADMANLLATLGDSGYEVHDLTDNELAKLHVRYMVGGRPSQPLIERLYGFEFPESQGALMRFLNRLGERWNITLFHYRNHGAAYGRVLAGFNVSDQEKAEFEASLDDVGYEWRDETSNPVYDYFLAHRD
ncbi:threonine ammonia-lyase, biosynthetic [Corallincola luteus]|uniref:L-threonine dehydratase n=1 Tax=Corallincola luteus TaxID=1775177 RepID=A0ABY2AJU4_9GAMM|nr:threonine ammonia-lyase, biosynthetic [Corallincola luteus]TCI02672.1 threonine ammonia-lyase, biosynthetic [Corallincola luteus]